MQIEPRYENINSKFAFPAGLLALAASLVADYLGYSRMAWALGFVIIAILGLVAIYWHLRHEKWFWASMIVIAAIHAVVVVFVPWSDHHYPGLLLLFPAMIDLVVMAKFISLIARYF